MENNTLCNRHSLGVNNHTKMYVTYTRIYGWSDYGGESSYQPGYRLENMMWMTLLVYDYIIPGESIYLTGQKDYEILNISKNKDKKLRIALKDYGDLTVDKNDFFNVIDGGYFEKDWVSENEESAE